MIIKPIEPFLTIFRNQSYSENKNSHFRSFSDQRLIFSDSSCFFSIAIGTFCNLPQICTRDFDSLTFLDTVHFYQKLISILDKSRLFNIWICIEKFFLLPKISLEFIWTTNAIISGQKLHISRYEWSICEDILMIFLIF